MSQTTSGYNIIYICFLVNNYFTYVIYEFTHFIFDNGTKYFCMFLKMSCNLIYNNCHREGMNACSGVWVCTRTHTRTQTHTQIYIYIYIYIYAVTKVYSQINNYTQRNSYIYLPFTKLYFLSSHNKIHWLSMWYDFASFSQIPQSVQIVKFHSHTLPLSHPISHKKQSLYHIRTIIISHKDNHHIR